MTLIHNMITGTGQPPIVFIHGFACALGDWDAQVAHLSPRHRTIAVDLRGHGASPGTVDECSIERYGADVAEIMRALDLPPAVIVGHSMGCRVAIEAALQAPSRAAGVILVDGSQGAAANEAVLRDVFAKPGGYAATTGAAFKDMFTAKSDKTMAAAVVERALRLPQAIGEKLMTDIPRYDGTRLTASLAALRVKLMAVQTTDRNEHRSRTSLRAGQTTPYLDMIRAAVPAARIEVIADTGHFPQLDEAGQVNALLDRFLIGLSAGPPE